MLLSTGLATIAYLQLLIIAGSFFHVEGREGFGGFEQEWNYVKVRPNAHMFWWLYYTTSEDVMDVCDKPLLIWIQGEAGLSSTGVGNFEDFGPLDFHLNPRNFTWVNDYNVLFIDSPVGTGFSYTDDISGYAKNSTQIAADLLQCLIGFYNELPEWLPVPTYVITLSYGGKYVVDLALIWDQAQKVGSIESNFQGIVLINSWISPIDTVLSYGAYLFNLGFVDTAAMKHIDKKAMEVKTAVEKGQWIRAQQLHYDTKIVMQSEIGNINHYNVIHKMPLHDDTEFRLRTLMNNEVKKGLHDIPNNFAWGSQGSSASNMLVDDNIKPVTNQVERILNETDITVFVLAGQLDLFLPPPGTVAWVERLRWKNFNKWQAEARHPILANGAIEGQIKEYGNFKMCWINNAGHRVPKENPAAMAVVLNHLTANGKYRKVNGKHQPYRGRRPKINRRQPKFNENHPTAIGRNHRDKYIEKTSYIIRLSGIFDP